jgi:hypothetical protein
MSDKLRDAFTALDDLINDPEVDLILDEEGLAVVVGESMAYVGRPYEVLSTFPGGRGYTDE